MISHLIKLVLGTDNIGITINNSMEATFPPLKICSKAPKRKKKKKKMGKTWKKKIRINAKLLF